jgi:predicted component of type VI protein secretion system
MPFRLRHLQHNFELGIGEFAIGRSADCQLSLDDPLVSRKHALLVVRPDSVVIKDLGSRNGVVVNGIKIDTSRVLINGDRVLIGSQELTLLAVQGSSRENQQVFRRHVGAQTLSSFAARPSTPGSSLTPGAESIPARISPEAGKEATSNRVNSFPLLSTLADKALALGRPEEAERILASLMTEVLSNAQRGDVLPTETVDQAAQYGVRLAGATAKGSWVDYVVALYAAVRRPCPGPIVDELHGVVRKTNTVDLASLRAYVDLLRAASIGFGPAERFLVQRIEGLERLVASK